jgi:hypothetical protein
MQEEPTARATVSLPWSIQWCPSIEPRATFLASVSPTRRTRGLGAFSESCTKAWRVALHQPGASQPTISTTERGRPRRSRNRAARRVLRCPDVRSLCLTRLTKPGSLLPSGRSVHVPMNWAFLLPCAAQVRHRMPNPPRTANCHQRQVAPIHFGFRFMAKFL